MTIARGNGKSGNAEASIQRASLVLPAMDHGAMPIRRSGCLGNRTGSARHALRPLHRRSSGIDAHWPPCSAGGKLSGRLTPDQASAALRRLLRWRGDRYPLTPLLRDGWTLRANLTVADALYFVFAVRLGVPLVTDDHRLANAPNLPVGLRIRTIPTTTTP
jgi:hypothetical protein